MPKVILVGGPDVDARIELMNHLKGSFTLSALGSLPSLEQAFVTQGFDYGTYRLNRKANPLADFFTLCQLIMRLRTLNPHIVHTFDTKPAVWARLAAKVAGVPIVIGTVPGLGYLYSNQDWKTRLLRSIYERLQALACRQSDMTVFQNSDDARYFVSSEIVSQHKAMIILGSGVPTNVFSQENVSETTRAQLRDELGIGPQEIVVTMISRVIRSKGIQDFVTAARNVREAFPNAHFLLVGPDDKNSLDALHETELAELKQSITWPGRRNDIPSVLGITDIFVLPSAYPEGIPRVLLEAASMGLPIVTTDAPGCNEVVENGNNGFLVPKRDVPALSQAVLRLVREPELRRQFGRVSRTRAVERFDISVVAAQTRSLYQQLLSSKSTSQSERAGTSRP